MNTEVTDSHWEVCGLQQKSLWSLISCSALAAFLLRCSISQLHEEKIKSQVLSMHYTANNSLSTKAYTVWENVAMIAMIKKWRTKGYFEVHLAYLDMGIHRESVPSVKMSEALKVLIKDEIECGHKIKLKMLLWMNKSLPFDLLVCCLAWKRTLNPILLKLEKFVIM